MSLEKVAANLRLRALAMDLNEKVAALAPGKEIMRHPTITEAEYMLGGGERIRSKFDRMKYVFDDAVYGAGRLHDKAKRIGQKGMSAAFAGGVAAGMVGGLIPEEDPENDYRHGPVQAGLKGSALGIGLGSLAAYFRANKLLHSNIDAPIRAVTQIIGRSVGAGGLIGGAAGAGLNVALRGNEKKAEAENVDVPADVVERVTENPNDLGVSGGNVIPNTVAKCDKCEGECKCETAAKLANLASVALSAVRGGAKAVGDIYTRHPMFAGAVAGGAIGAVTAGEDNHLGGAATGAMGGAALGQLGRDKIKRYFGRLTQDASQGKLFD